MMWGLRGMAWRAAGAGGLLAASSLGVAAFLHGADAARGAPPEHHDTVTPSAASHPSRPTPTARPHARWADSVLATLSLHGKVAQMLMRWTPGSMSDARAMADAQRWVTDDSIGGFIISIGTPREIVTRINALQRASRVPLMFAADLEFGPGQRLIPGGGVFPPPMGIAATGDTAIACAHGRITAREARAVGIRWTFAPDIDLNVRPDNPIVNTRAYGETADVVSRYALPFIRCAQAEGLLTTVKHFVGHGRSVEDSHLSTPTVTLDRAALDAADLAPFREAVAAGVAAVMTAHVALPAVAGDSLPASLNPAITRAILRREWRYDGLVVTDALWMGGARSLPGVGPGEAAVRAVEAGNDVILDPPDHRLVIDAVVEAVRSGRLTEARVDSSVQRILDAKARVGLDRSRVIDPAVAVRHVGGATTDALVRDAARRSLVLALDRDSLVRGFPGTARTVLVVSWLDEGERPAPGLVVGSVFPAELKRLLAPRGITVRAIALTARTDSAALDSVAAQAAAADLVVLAPYIRPLASKGSIGLPPPVERVFRDALAANSRTIVVSFGDPYLVRQLPGLGAYLLAWNPWSAWAERAAARALVTRASDVRGHLPVTLGADLPAGSGIVAPEPASRPPTRSGTAAAAALVRERLRDTVRTILDQSVSDSAFPAAIAVVGSHRGTLIAYGSGHLDWGPSPLADEQTIWDLASLTKVIGTTTAIMQLVERGRVRLDAPVRRYLPRFVGAGKNRVTVRHLLTHSSGLPSGRPLYREATSPSAALELVYATPLQAVPGARTVYSDLGAILLGRIVERASGERLDRYLARHVFTPLGMRSTMFRPPDSLRYRTAPTEFDAWRQRHLRGEVHDENAVALGGIAGHAGLFSTARDLSRFATMYLQGGTLGGVRVLRPATIRQFTRVQDAAFSSRALGWDTPTGASSAGHLMSRRAFGHTGFTGTSIWIDPANDVFVLLLTNRVNPTRENHRISGVRVALADAVLGIVAPTPQETTISPAQP